MLLSCGSFGAEKWSDPRLPITDQPEVWLDASRENAARASFGLANILDGQPLDVWHDGSGHRRNVTQRLPSLRPKFKANGTNAWATFDGIDDFLAASNLREPFTNASVFVVAAPRSNRGFFRALFAINQSSRNDYQTGLNIDLGPGSSERFETLNAEGNGFGGALDLMTSTSPFGAFHVVALASEVGPKGVRLYIDGLPQGTRVRATSVLSMDEMTVGARCYSNSPEPPHTQGYFDGGIAEVLVYDRALSEKERAALDQYFREKYAAVAKSIGLSPVDGFRPPIVENPPPVQMLVPGFAVRELPLRLKNINNVKYREDGKLVALGYNGQIFILSDSDGDGLEDQAKLFWDKSTLRAPIGLALTPPGYPLGQGVFVPSKGKLSLIIDTNGDDVADREIIVAEGWKELSHGVDALGVAVDVEGNIYFGLGTANFVNGYLIDSATGKARYDLNNERGTILKVSPDFRRREIVCTGIRFPVALAFNSAGDLFCTDQEGATWLPNGNPFDELLQIVPGRHYGFPPRHPKHLPNVIDEPSVFDYSPQHQSTCGLNFNEQSGPIAGPAWWRGDAIVAGYSRGKLFRTKLAKTAAGYVAQSQTIACLNMLTVDACLSPRGDLVVATHSGAPDWGSGPEGYGTLYQIRHARKEIPQPVAVFRSGAAEIGVTFDRPLDPAGLRDLGRKMTITAGRYVAAGDRFESLRPGYQAVQDQLASPLHPIPVLATRLSQDLRTIFLNTPRETADLRYAMAFPAFWNTNKINAGDLTQFPGLDLVCDSNGVEAAWRDGAGEEIWSGWLPHLDLAVARALTAASDEHERLCNLAKRSGLLVLRGQIDLWQMLRPAVQPGAEIDYTPAVEEVTLTFASANPFKLKTPAGQVVAARPTDQTQKGGAGANPPTGRFRATVTRVSERDRWLPVELNIETSTNSEPRVEVTWHTNEDPRERAFPLRRFHPTWVTPWTEEVAPKAEREIPEVAGANWMRGRGLFFSEKAGCSKCHQIRGEGGKLGPDLSNLVYRDYNSVVKDIAFPNNAINPDHLASHVELTNGETLTGIVQAEKPDGILLGIASGESVQLPRKEIAAVRPASVSLMPEGLLQTLDATERKDLLAFLLTAPLEPGPLETKGEPPPRKRAEVEALIKSFPRSAAPLKPLGVLLVAGPKDHGPGEHDYPLWQKRWARLLSLADKVQVVTAFEWPNAAQIEAANIIVFYSDNPGWSLARAAELDRFLSRGGGLVYLHYAVDGHDQVEALSQRIGLAWRGGTSRFRHGPLDLIFNATHPLARGFEQLHVVDESYWALLGDAKRIDLLATGIEEGKAQPLVWTREEGKGRVFVSIPGHYTWTFDDPLFRLLLLRGMAWVAREPANRFDELCWIGARVAGEDGGTVRR